MKIIIQVNHIISFDPQALALLETIFPSQAIIDGLTKDIQDKTNALQTAVQENPAT